MLILFPLRSQCTLRAWSTENCPRVVKSCRPDSGDEDTKAYLCDHTGCHLRVAVILPNNTNYIVNAPEVISFYKNILKNYFLGIFDFRRCWRYNKLKITLDGIISYPVD